METTPVKNRFELEHEYYNICSMLEESDGELTPEIAELLAINEQDIANSFKRYHSFIQQHKANIEVTKDEIERLKNKLSSQEKLVVKVKDRALEALGIYGEVGKTGNRSLKFPDLTVFSRTSSSVEVNDVFDETLETYLDPQVFDAMPDEIAPLNDCGNVVVKITCDIATFYEKYGDVVAKQNPDEEIVRFEYVLSKTKAKEFIGHGNASALETLGVVVKDNQSVTFK